MLTSENATHGPLVDVTGRFGTNFPGKFVLDVLIKQIPCFGNLTRCFHSCFSASLSDTTFKQRCCPTLASTPSVWSVNLERLS